ncbi:hypothetical protein [Bacteroides sp. 519]|uniref:hypothetical protein n=1 Tax=Bacteroides sp. 519 TaxID=2302937 RepID=UPI0013D3AE39|nr:hypothetical protein [Bacteroides sp. 519]NDV57198.1 hypothetical protein [Bacteroides sp. 519]
MTKLKSLTLLPLLVVITVYVMACENDDEEYTPLSLPHVYLSNNEITIADIVGIPNNVTINKLKVEITGADWEIIDVIESTYSDGKFVLSLPDPLPDSQLQKVVRDNASDYAGHWRAETNNPKAKVARLLDIVAYNNDEPVGVLCLTDWPQEGTIVGKSWIYYHYSNQTYTLSGTYGSYVHQASFQKGWNAYANTNVSEEADYGSVICTTEIPMATTYIWYFKGY